MQKIFSKFGVLVFLLLGFCFLSASAQANSCDLQLNIFENSSKEKIKNSKLELVNFDTFQILKASSKDGTKTFNNLNKGKYRVKIETQGFKTSFKRIYLNCNKDLLTEEIFLRNGKSSEKLFLLEDDFNLISGEIFFDEDINVIGVSMPRPAYSKRCSSDCEVKVLISIDEQGNVASAQVLSGRKHLYDSTEKAAKNSKFLPVFYKGKIIKVKGIMTYIFK